ncbi:MAG: PspC domain-containing protein [Candidatus Thermochlorobacter aerophilum]|jgi:phage shock protein PspC (stress-responsive transcriptional regulator)|uniref:PspC domain-containing protein n=1 Tax=Candidatus Thermochlorobacter aerophilus TaxID=1868324 RepID=A0A395M2X1_9BACT|nr:MAG: PspC domain-containing protein [Candidatus Thermochlorobacter aerophilum]
MKRLYRSSRERMIAGVAGGLAEYFDIDPVFVRILFVASIFLSGIGILIYLVLWIITPQTPSAVVTSSENASQFGATPATQTLSPEELEAQKKRNSTLIGIGLIALGIIIFLELLLPSFSVTYLFPLALIGAGGFLIWKTFVAPSHSNRSL